MKEIFNWVPWFVELSQKIAENDKDFLAQKARQLPWKEDGGEIPLLQHGDDNIDPFSFIYTLAAYQSARKRIYAGVSEVFGLTSELLFELDDLFIFPTPQPNNVLFHPVAEETLTCYGGCSAAQSRASIKCPPTISIRHYR